MGRMKSREANLSEREFRIQLNRCLNDIRRYRRAGIPFARTEEKLLDSYAPDVIVGSFESLAHIATATFNKPEFKDLYESCETSSGDFVSDSEYEEVRAAILGRVLSAVGKNETDIASVISDSFSLIEERVRHDIEAKLFRQFNHQMDWKAQWPGYCPVCQGWGGIGDYGARDSSLPGHIWSPCEAIDNPEACHRCGERGLGPLGVGPCSECGWDRDDGLPS